MVKSVVTGDFESDNNFNLKALEHEDDTACDEWNAESTLKLKKVVVSVRQQFKWQSTGADATHLQRKTLRRVARPEDFRSQAPTPLERVESRWYN